MKSNSKITPHSLDKFNGITIGDEHTTPEKVEYVCSWCNHSLVRLVDRNNQSESWFCRNCSIEFNPDDEQVSHKQKLSIPYQDSEPAVATTPGIPDISIRHTPPLRGTYVYPLLPCGYDSAAIFSTIS
jgi:hypothetical protein